MSSTITSTYSTLTFILGFGRVSSLAMRQQGGLTWGQIHALTDAGLIRYLDCPAGIPVYLLMFP